MNNKEKQELNKNENIQDIKLEDNVIHKIYAIQSKVGAIIKEKKNTRLGYEFFDEPAVYEILKPLLKEYKLAIVPYDDLAGGFEWQHVGNLYIVRYFKRIGIFNVKSGNDVTVQDIVNKVDDSGNLSYKLTDESITISFWAIGSNTDPAKAKGAAETYAMKYMLTKLFMIPIEDKSDPDCQEAETKNFSSPNKYPTVALNEKSQKLYDLFIEVRGNDIGKQKELLFELDKIVVGIDKYKLDTNTGTHNFRERLNLLDEVDYKRYWDALENKKTK